jgi:hypothetical protein
VLAKISWGNVRGGGKEIILVNRYLFSINNSHYILWYILTKNQKTNFQNLCKLKALRFVAEMVAKHLSLQKGPFGGRVYMHNEFWADCVVFWEKVNVLQLGGILDECFGV